MERNLVDRLFRIFRSEYEKLDFTFRVDEVWKNYLRQYEDIFFIDSIWDLTEAVNHSDVFKGSPVAIPNPSSCTEVLILTREFAEKILAFGLPCDMSVVAEKF